MIIRQMFHVKHKAKVRPAWRGDGQAAVGVGGATSAGHYLFIRQCPIGQKEKPAPEDGAGEAAVVAGLRALGAL